MYTLFFLSSFIDQVCVDMDKAASKAETFPA
jgi:hypothetical protein